MKININIRNLQEQYNKAIKNNKSSFVYDGQEILTSYARYLLEYLNGGK